MKNIELKYVKDGYAAGKPADIYFYDDVENWSAKEFISEFQYLENFVCPSKIRVHIISVGGSCFEGIKVVSAILNSSVIVETINDGLAASMASVIWASGKIRKMRDYAVLMIHNPFLDKEDDERGDESDIIVETFKKQLQIIYKNRFGFDDETVTKIMDGEDGHDGTWMFAEDAVKAGIIEECDIIKSEKNMYSVAASIREAKSISDICAILKATDQLPVKEKNSEKEDIFTNSIKESEMTENEIKMVAAQLGFPDEKATGANVTTRVNALLEKEKEYDSVKENLDSVSAELKTANENLQLKETEIAGFKASVENLTQNLEDVKNELKVYKDAEEAARKASIEAMVDNAIQAGKVKAESKETWMKLADSNFDTVKETLDSIPARSSISKEIADDVNNLKDAQDGMKSEEEIIKAKIDEAIGKEFQFRTLE